jgi:ribosomal protein S18 acetylase RimI-like enzyme
MNWNLVEEDFKFMRDLEPDGCFTLFGDSERIGLATTISFGKVGWLGNVIVSKKFREKGVGSLLVRHSMEYLTEKHVETIGLYSYTNEIPFYERLGFMYDSEFVVLNKKESSSPEIINIKEAEKDDIMAIIQCDSLCFGASRKKLLKPILNDPTNLHYISKERGQILGFTVAKVYDGMVEVGPLVCQHGRTDIAIDLLKRAMDRLKSFEITICIPKKESPILETLVGIGFSEVFRVARMFWGRPIIRDCIYIAESLERG